MNRKTYQLGQGIVEVVVALGTAVVIISAIAIAVITALDNAQYSKNQNLATQYAQEGMEIVRQIRDSDYNKFTSYGNTGKTYCLGKNTQQLIPTDADCEQNVEAFVRKVMLENNSESCLSSLSPTPTGTPQTPTRVEIVVLWSDSKCSGNVAFCHQVELVSCLSGINVIPTIQ